jgi:hypothetical protein
MALSLLPLALEAGLPLIHVRTDDVLNVEDVLNFIVKATFKPLQIPMEINKVAELKVPEGQYFYTSNECKSLKKLYLWCVDNEKTIVFVNTEKSKLHFDGGQLVPPKELVLKMLSEVSNNANELLPSFGGMTLKDVCEVAKLTMTRDSSLTVRGVNETRRGYNLKGITPVDTNISYYAKPSYLANWLDSNTKFFMNPIHPSLTPRGLLFDGPPGTGKTLAAKYIASSFGIPLYHLDIGALKGKYVGESEGNLLAALAQVDEVEPCVVILDEIEKVFQTFGDSGVSSSLLSQLLWWLQEHKTKVFTVMTTNDVSKIPVELYREGRVDATMEFLGIETYAEGLEFANGAFNVMCTEVEHPELINDKKSVAHLSKRIKSLYGDNMPVPQSRLTQETYNVIKELFNYEEES